jgi:uncharacterized protein (TIRG00374 family)
VTLVAPTPWRAAEVATTRKMAKVQVWGREGLHTGHRLRLILSTAVGLLLLALAFRGIEWHQVGRAVAGANHPLLALALGTVLLTTLAKAARWRLLFPQEYGRPRLSKLFPVLLIGQTVNAVLPARLGEIARAYLIGEIEGVDKAQALSTVMVEKALDALMLLLLVALLFVFMPLPGWLGRSGILVSGLLAVVLLLVILAAYRSKGTPSALRRFLSWIPGIHRFDLERRLGAFIAVFSFQFSAFSWSVFVWAMAALTNYVTFLALGIEVPFLAALFLLVALHLGVTVPSSPGRVGVFHYICVLSLSLFSVDRSLALSYGLVLHLIVFAPMMSLGAWFLWKENYELSKSKAGATLGAGEGTDP